MLLVCVRHLPTTWNARGVLQGQRDTELLPLDDHAREAIGRNRKLLAAHNFDIVLASSLQRTRASAEQYGHLEALAEPLLDELAFGPWEGKPRAELEAAFDGQWLKDPREMVLGESLAELAARIRRFLHKYCIHDQVLAFGHGSWMRALVSIARHGDVRAMNHFFIENSSVHRFEVEQGGDAVREIRAE